MSENINYEEKNINNKPEYKQVSDPFEEKFFDAIRKGQFITKSEEYISDKEEKAFIASNIIMGNATKPEKDKAFNYKYANIERLNDCISLATEEYNEKLEKSKSAQRVVLNFKISVNMFKNTDCVAIVKHKCILYDTITNELISKYIATEEILMQNMFPDVALKDLSKCDEFIKYKGKCITYAKRYALLQFMMPSKLEEDPEESDKKAQINKRNNIITKPFKVNAKDFN